MKEYGQYGWLPGQDIPKLIHATSTPIGIEIGTSLGYTTEYLLDSLPTLHLHGVDPYTSYTDWEGSNYNNDFKSKEFESFLSRIATNGARYTHHRKTSDDAAEDFTESSMDFIFIDGLHTYEQVLKDCQNYYPKLKSGGLFCGHDFSAIEGVQKAVKQFANTANRSISLAHQDIWYWYK